jgi:hypothetical protein
MCVNVLADGNAIETDGDAHAVVPVPPPLAQKVAFASKAEREALSIFKILVLLVTVCIH